MTFISNQRDEAETRQCATLRLNGTLSSPKSGPRPKGAEQERRERRKERKPRHEWRAATGGEWVSPAVSFRLSTFCQGAHPGDQGAHQGAHGGRGEHLGKIPSFVPRCSRCSRCSSRNEHLGESTRPAPTRSRRPDFGELPSGLTLRDEDSRAGPASEQRNRSRSPRLRDFTPHRHPGAGRALPAGPRVSAWVSCPLPIGKQTFSRTNAPA
jgi:hypothetical protein